MLQCDTWLLLCLRIAKDREIRNNNLHTKRNCVNVLWRSFLFEGDDCKKERDVTAVLALDIPLYNCIYI